MNTGGIRVLVRGAGDMATGIGHRLFKSGFRVFMTEIERPACIRRRVAFSEAVYEGSTEVEGVTSVLAHSPREAEEMSGRGYIPVLIDPLARAAQALKPDAVVDVIMAKKNLGTGMDMAPVVIGVGPGFTAGVDCHAVVETMRGHNLGRVIYQGEASRNTGVPGEVAGFARERVVYTPGNGIIKSVCEIGTRVKAGQLIAVVGENRITAPIDGVVRGLIRDGFAVTKGMKIGDVDPRGIIDNCYTISDKARAVGGGVLESLMHCLNIAGL
ncbi:MAG: selenium-dependent molybdenum cofactor biosynthesis protein YqeB [Firmicutes bacterium]|jgi:xanthine dehydrogenase accessory factor|nr:selenium-dependent molybdenum cofactor biosynthesis protein YqeB [Bacillota bacterium]MDD3297902.1 selenium-dependent molybdenum cofactor biosynthesis protein YqeB [Bacillota bacterium]MDD4707705.1 selenium-dependent molybdenum cofactor biosynthesis protein YqeB [Bacillota bacterium]